MKQSQEHKLDNSIVLTITTTKTTTTTRKRKQEKAYIKLIFVIVIHTLFKCKINIFRVYTERICFIL
jgi:hypothetical protein